MVNQILFPDPAKEERVKVGRVRKIRAGRARVVMMRMKVRKVKV